MNSFLVLDAIRSNWSVATVSFSLGVLSSYASLRYCKSRLQRRLALREQVFRWSDTSSEAGEQTEERIVVEFNTVSQLCTALQAGFFFALLVWVGGLAWAISQR